MRAAKLLLSLVLLGATAQAAQRNVLFIAVDDLRPELGAYGRDYIASPHIDQLAASGLLFERHYVQAPTCGASRYALLTGTYSTPPFSGNGALLRRAAKLTEAPDALPPTLPAWLRQHGYQTIAIGKISHYPGGLAGENWEDPSRPETPFSWDRKLMPTGPWQHPRGAMHGLANGEIRNNAAQMDVFQSVDGPDTLYPDGWITEAALETLDALASGERPFFLAVGIIRPHLPFGAPARYMEPYADIVLPPIPHPERPEGVTSWHGSSEFMRYHRWGKDPREDTVFADQVRRHYAAAVSYADAQVGRIIDHLKERGLYESTTIILWGDHGYHLGEHSIWGKHSLFEESLHSPLIIRAPHALPTGARTDAIAETIDLFPTVCELLGLPSPDFVDGQSLLEKIRSARADAAIGAVSYHGSMTTLRTDSHRLVVHESGDVELYDHRSPEAETRNRAGNEPERALAMVQQLQKRIPHRVPDELIQRIRSKLVATAE